MIPLKEIAIDPLAQELVRSEQARPYTNYFMKAYSNDAAGIESALQVLRDLPLEKRYTWRVFSALKWALADFDDECVRLDLPHIPETTTSRDDEGTSNSISSIRDVAESLQRMNDG